MSEKRYDDILLISDLDGTIVPRYEMISDENIRAVHTFTEYGGAFAIATGRAPDAAIPYLEGIAVNAPSIFFNGAMLKDLSTDCVLETRALDGDIWRDFAAQVLFRFPRACVEVYTAADCNVLTPEENDDPRLDDEFYNVRRCPLRDVERETWLKFFVCDAPVNLTFVERLAKELGIDKISTSFYSDANYLEYVAPGTSKGDMADVLRAMPAYAGRRVIACGDYGNDVSLLRTADIGVAPADASEEAKAAADRVGVPCGEHLIAWILKEVL
ncbi:HAD-IIB family hydrolase [Selenomonas sp. F0473]|uniref:HAD-IIB family hydrolase n=1 Tax=Selenomonas sp. F0473 TaxID=999423 RepID=UPI0025D3F4F1|nr:HAD family hydrolase [Selenomonas sp. F0473]